MFNEILRIISVLVFLLFSIIAIFSSLAVSTLYSLADTVESLTQYATNKSLMTPFLGPNSTEITLMIIFLVSSFVLSILTSILLLKRIGKYRVTGALSLLTFFISSYTFLYSLNIISVIFVITAITFLLLIIRKV
jgi:hypothetical protein